LFYTFPANANETLLYVFMHSIFRNVCTEVIKQVQATRKAKVTDILPCDEGKGGIFRQVMGFWVPGIPDFIF